MGTATEAAPSPQAPRAVQLHREMEGERQVRFHWDCKWRAQQEGWVDYFGFPDQIRAAREFGWRCFERWEPLPS